MLKRFTTLLLTLFTFTGIMVCTTGCDVKELERLLGLDKPEEALFVFSFHRVVNYPRGNAKAEQALRLPNGKEVIIDRYPIISSHNIVDIAAEPIPDNDGFYKLYFKLDQKGRMMWMQLTGEARHDPVIILLDGLYFGEFECKEVSNGVDIWVEFPIPVDGARAQSIVKYANDNYRFFNGTTEDRNPFSRNNEGKIN